MSDLCRKLAEAEDQHLREVFNLSPDQHLKTLADLKHKRFKCPLCGKSKKATQAIIEDTGVQTIWEKNTLTVKKEIRVICKRCAKPKDYITFENEVKIAVNKE